MSPRKSQPSPSASPGPLTGGPGDSLGSPDRVPKKGTFDRHHPNRLWAKPFALEMCRRCRQPVLVGASDALNHTLEPYALTRTGELAAVINNRRTFTLHIYRSKIDAHLRWSWDITYGKASDIVVAEHAHGRPVFDFDPDKSRRILDVNMPAPMAEAAVECPF